MRRPPRLHLEILEDRCVPAMFGVPWHEASRITVSIVPDGTNILGTPSNLHQTLNANADVDVWVDEILRALQSWAVQSNVNFALVPDDGSPFGTSGPAQGDERFGDIRIGALSQGNDVIAIASPPDLFAGTFAGDVLLNSKMTFGGSDGLDVYSVALHEIGHSLGVRHSNVANAAMGSLKLAVGETLSLDPSDVAMVQSLYGARSTDEYEGDAGNETLADASRLKPLPGNLNLDAQYFVEGDLTTRADVDVYSFSSKGNAHSVSVRLSTKDVSLLQPTLTVYDENGAPLQQWNATGPAGDDLVVDIDGLSGKKDFYIAVSSTSGDDFEIGAYQLSVTFDGVDAGAPADVDNAKPHPGTIRPDLQSFLNALLLAFGNGDADGDYLVTRSAIDFPGDLDVFRVHSPKVGVNALVVTLRTIGQADAEPTFQVYDAGGEALAAEVLIHSDGVTALQVQGVAPNKPYFISVIDGRNPGSTYPYEYVLSAEFLDQPIELTTYASGAFGSDGSQTAGLFTGESQLYHFLLTAPGNSGASVTVVDAAGATVFTLQAPANGVQSANVALPAGAYLVEFAGASGTSFVLSGIDLSDPIGPRLEDVIGAPIPESAPLWVTAPASGQELQSTLAHRSSLQSFLDPATVVGSSHWQDVWLQEGLLLQPLPTGSPVVSTPPPSGSGGSSGSSSTGAGASTGVGSSAGGISTGVAGGSTGVGGSTGIGASTGVGSSAGGISTGVVGGSTSGSTTTVVNSGSTGGGSSASSGATSSRDILSVLVPRAPAFPGAARSGGFSITAGGTAVFASPATNMGNASASSGLNPTALTNVGVTRSMPGLPAAGGVAPSSEGDPRVTLAGDGVPPATANAIDALLENDPFRDVAVSVRPVSSEPADAVVADSSAGAAQTSTAPAPATSEEPAERLALPREDEVEAALVDDSGSSGFGVWDLLAGACAVAVVAMGLQRFAPKTDAHQRQLS